MINLQSIEQNPLLFTIKSGTLMPMVDSYPSDMSGMFVPSGDLGKPLIVVGTVLSDEVVWGAQVDLYGYYDMFLTGSVQDSLQSIMEVAIQHNADIIVDINMVDDMFVQTLMDSNIMVYAEQDGELVLCQPLF